MLPSLRAVLNDSTIIVNFKIREYSLIYYGRTTFSNSYYEKFADGKVVCIDDEIPFEIPNGWEWCRLGDLVDFSKSKSVKACNIDPNAWLLDLEDIEKDSGKLLQKKRMATITSISDKHKFKKGNVLYSKLRPYLNKVIIADEEGYCTSEILCFDFGMIYSRYAQLFLMSPFFVEYAMSDAYGVKMPRLGSKQGNKGLIPIPPIEEQRRIANFISSLDPFIEKYSKAQASLDRMNKELKETLRKSILQEAIQGKLVPQDSSDEPALVLLQHIKEEKQRLVKEGKLKKKDIIDSTIFRDDDNKYYEQIGKEVVDITENIPFKIPDSWVWYRMGAIGIWGAGSTPSKGNPNYYGGNILWLRTGELNNSVVYDTEIKITQKALEECSLRMNKVGDILIAMYGATIGKVAIVGKEMTTNQACCACTPIGVFNWYLFYFLMASQQYFIKIGEGGAQPNISREKLISYLIPIPPIAEQMRIVEKLKTILNKIKD